MEIDFLGLYNSKDSSYNLMKINQSSTVNPFIDSGVDVCLSLRTTSPLLYSETEELPYFSESNTWRFSSIYNYSPENAPTTEQQAHIASVPSTLQSDRYNHSHTRDIQENSAQPEAALLTILCPATPHHTSALKQVGCCTKIVGNRGYTPTVAMARRATLARFLQKRSHRLTQTRAAHHLMGVSLNVPKAGNIKGNDKNSRPSYSV